MILVLTDVQQLVEFSFCVGQDSVGLIVSKMLK